MSVKLQGMPAVPSGENPQLVALLNGITQNIIALANAQTDLIKIQSNGYSSGSVSLTDIAAAITALSLGTAATKNIGTTAGTVCAGDDSRIAVLAEGSTAWVVPTIANGSQASPLSLSVPSVGAGDYVWTSCNGSLGGLQLWGESGSASVTFRMFNGTGSSTAPASNLSYYYKVFNNPYKTVPVVAITWDPAHKGSICTLSGGNLVAATSGAWTSVRATQSFASGVHYFVVTVGGSGYGFVGVVDASANINSYIGFDAHGWGYDNYGPFKRNNAVTAVYGGAYSAGSQVKIEVAYSGSTATITAYLWSGSVWVSQGVMYSGVTGPLYPAVSMYSLQTMTGDFAGMV